MTFLEFMDSLDDDNLAGLDHKKTVRNGYKTKTQTGRITTVTRSWEITYTMSLVALSREQAKELAVILRDTEQQNSRIDIPVNRFTGYIGEKTITSDMNFDSTELSYDEMDDLWSITLPVTEVTLNGGT